LRDRGLAVTVTDARLGDPMGEVSMSLPPGAAGPGAVGVASRCGPSDADEVSGASLFRPFPVRTPRPVVGRLDPRFSDEFDGSRLDRRWRWVRGPDGHLGDGRFIWPTQVGDFVGMGNAAAALLRAMPEGDYTVQTALDIDLGEGNVRNYQQAGLIVYAGDDLFVRLNQVAIGETRQIEYGKETPFAGGTSYGWSVLGPPPRKVWLRLVHRTDPGNREHEFRAWMSREDRNHDEDHHVGDGS
jgi:arabinan endo-1,5-alpha-L-arabinosidase